MLMDYMLKKERQVAIFAAGCFWGVQAVFDDVSGVTSTEVGYIGGRKGYTHPSYDLVCTGKTRHAEVVKIVFDPEKVSYEHLLDIFWINHDPTTFNRQGLDIGAQYRSAVFYFTEEQKSVALLSKHNYQNRLKKPIVTEVVKASEFYPAESCHQKYYQTHNLTCHIALSK